MTTKQELDASFDSLSETALRVKRERDLLLTVVKEILELAEPHIDCSYCGYDATRIVRLAKKTIRRVS